MPITSPERIGQFELRVMCCAPSPDSAARSQRRIEALAAWLLAQWRAEHLEGEHGGRDE